jgi:hypothetical protein
MQAVADNFAPAFACFLTGYGEQILALNRVRKKLQAVFIANTVHRFIERNGINVRELQKI